MELVVCRRCGAEMSRGTAVFAPDPTAAAPAATPPPAAPAAIQPPASYPVDSYPSPGYPPAYPYAPPGYPPQYGYPHAPYGYGYGQPWSIAASRLYPAGDGFGRRIGACIIDGLALATVVWGVFFGGLALLSTPAAPLGVAMMVFTYVSPFFNWLLLAALWGRGQTLGMHLLGLRMVDIHGNPPGFSRGLIRVLSSVVSGLCLYIGYLAMFWDPEQQTWHDKWSGIWVVRA